MVASRVIARRREHSQEMRFRLALFGAWHLADSPDERRSIRKTLRDAYDTASKAVHLGEIPDGTRPKVTTVRLTIHGRAATDCSSMA